MNISREELINFINQEFKLNLPKNSAFLECSNIRNIKTLHDIDVSIIPIKVATAGGKYIFFISLDNIKLADTKDKGYNLAWIETNKDRYSAEEKQKIYNVLNYASSTIAKENEEAYKKLKKETKKLEDDFEKCKEAAIAELCKLSETRENLKKAGIQTPNKKKHM